MKSMTWSGLGIALSLILWGIPGFSAEEDKARVEIWTKAGFTGVEAAQIELGTVYSQDPPSRYTHEASPVAVLVRQTGWSRAEIEAHFRRSAEIFKQCQVRLKNIPLITVDPFPKELARDAFFLKKLAKMTPMDALPVVFFVDRVQGDDTSFALRPGANDPPLENLIFMMSAVNSAEYLKYRKKEYNPLAHELTHLFSNVEHNRNPIDNLMKCKDHGDVTTVVNPANDFILPDHCTWMKVDKFRKKMLTVAIEKTIEEKK